MPKKSKKQKKRIPLKVGAKAKQTEGKITQKVEVVAQGTGTGGPGSRGGPGAYKKTNPRKPIRKAGMFQEDLDAILRSKEQASAFRRRYGGSSLASSFPSNYGFTGSVDRVSQERPDVLREQIRIGVRDELVKQEQRRQFREQAKSTPQVARETARTDRIPERAITQSPRGVRVDTGKLVPFVKAGTLDPQERISDEGKKYKVIERREDQLRRIVSVPFTKAGRIEGVPKPSRVSRRPVFEGDFRPEPEGESESEGFETTTESEPFDTASESGDIQTSTDESDFETFPTPSPARRLPPVLEQPLTNEERIRRLELRQFEVQTPEQIEAQRQRDLQQFKVNRDRVYTRTSRSPRPTLQLPQQSSESESESGLSGAPSFSDISSESESSTASFRRAVERTKPKGRGGLGRFDPVRQRYFPESDSSSSSDSSGQEGRGGVRRARSRTPSIPSRSDRESISSDFLGSSTETASPVEFEETKVRTTQRYTKRAPRGTAKDRLPKELREEVSELESRVEQIKKALGEKGIARTDVSKGGVKKQQSGIRARLTELGLLGEQQVQLLLEELFSKMARLKYLRNIK